MLKIISRKEFEDKVLKTSKLTFVDFFATWCGPCQMLAPILEEIAEDYDELDIMKIDIDKERDLAIDYEIEFVPTIIIFKDGRELDRIQGVVNKEDILEKIKMYK